MSGEDDDAARRTAELEAITALYGDDVAVLPAQNAQRGACAVKVTLADAPVGGCPVEVTLDVPLRYPSTAPLTGGLEGKGLPHTAARHLAAKALAAQTPGEESLFLVLEEVKELCAAYEASAAGAAPVADELPNRFGRRLMYSHHIINATKRKDIKEWALELGLGAVCKIGWPGIIVCEGDEAACVEYVARLQSHRWKYFVVRGEEVLDIPPGRGGVDALRALPRGYQELGEDDMKALASMCKEAGLEELFMTSMKVYK